MSWPCLVLEQWCKTDISLEFDREGLNEYGEPLDTVSYSGKCNYQDKARTVLTAEKSWWRSLERCCFREISALVFQ